MSVLTGTEIFHSNGQTKMATETEYTTMSKTPKFQVSKQKKSVELKLTVHDR